MKSRGILMSGEMVRAWLNGWKGQTRRTRGLDQVNENPDAWTFEGYVMGKALFHRTGTAETVSVRPPYGFVGDQLYFKETWKMFEREDDGKDFLHFRADDAKVDPVWWTEDDWRAPNPKWCTNTVFKHWQSSMLMPKMCARIHVPITGVRVERLQDITVQDAKAEGIHTHERYSPMDFQVIKEYRKLWDLLNAKRGHSWTHNDWVWVYEFEKNKTVKA